MSLCLGRYGLYLGYRTGGRAFNPDDLGGALRGWYDAEDFSTLDLTGGLVNSITDKRNPGYALSQSNDERKPAFIASSAVNNRPALRGDGVDDFLKAEGHPYPTGAAPVIIIALAALPLEADGSARTIFSFGEGSVNNDIRMRKNASDYPNTLLANTQATDTGAYLRGTHIIRSESTGTHVITRIDDRAPVSVAAVGSVAATRCAMFSTPTFNGQQFLQGDVNSIFIIDPTHANWTPGNEAALYGFLTKRAFGPPPGAITDSLFGGEYVTDALFDNEYVLETIYG
ncbi:MAG: hypothetical protein AB7E55_33580 [Pigmentiphaga sp.]